MKLDKVYGWERSLSSNHTRLLPWTPDGDLQSPCFSAIWLLLPFVPHRMISLTTSAIDHLKSLIAEKQASPGTGLRLSVEKGGCAGMQYVMSLDQSREGDAVHEQGGVSVIIGTDSLGYLDGCEIDYVDSLADSGFKLNNPNAARSCGCGTSFEPQPKEN